MQCFFRRVTMEKKRDKNNIHLPKKYEILRLYKSLNLDEETHTSYDLNAQMTEFKRFSIYTDKHICYATSNTEATK